VPIFDPTYDPDSYSVLTIRTVGRYVRGRSGITDADVDAWAAALEARGAEDDYLFSINRYCFLGVAE
jgi:hypothetical protein